MVRAGSNLPVRKKINKEGGAESLENKCRSNAAAVLALREHHHLEEGRPRMIADKLTCNSRIPSHRAGKEDRIHALHEEANISFLSHLLTVRVVQEADVLIVGSAALRISRENPCKVPCTRSRPEDMAVQGRADLLRCGSNTRRAATQEAGEERSHDCVAGEMVLKKK